MPRTASTWSSRPCRGGPDVIVDGQVALAIAGKRNGVRRIVPSDYALDLFRATPGEHAAFDARRAADERIAALGLEQVNVLQGAFMEMFLPGRGAIDFDRGTIGFFGDGQRPVEVTSVEDTAPHGRPRIARPQRPCRQVRLCR